MPSKLNPGPEIKGPILTVRQIAERHPALTIRTLRHWIFNAEDRIASAGHKKVVIPGNGFGRVILRKGRRVFINEAALLEWLRNSC